MYLAKHPQVCASQIKEIGFFLPVREGNPAPPLSDYEKYFPDCGDKMYRLEATPSYLYGNEKMINEMKNSLGDFKIIFILRNPVERLISFYKRGKSRLTLAENLTFESFINESISKWQSVDGKKNDHYSRGVAEGCYSKYILQWEHAMPGKIKILFFDDLQNNTSMFMQQLCEWLHLDFGVYHSGDFTIENKTRQYRNRVLHRIVVGMNTNLESFWRRNHKLKKFLRSGYNRLMEKKKKEEIDSDSIATLKNLYSPYNLELRRLLESKGYGNFPEWMN